MLTFRNPQFHAQSMLTWCLAECELWFGCKEIDIGYNLGVPPPTLHEAIIHMALPSNCYDIAFVNLQQCRLVFPNTLYLQHNLLQSHFMYYSLNKSKSNWSNSAWVIFVYNEVGAPNLMQLFRNVQRNKYYYNCTQWCCSYSWLAVIPILTILFLRLFLSWTIDSVQVNNFYIPRWIC